MNDKTAEDERFMVLALEEAERASRIGEVVSRDELLDEVWGYDLYPTTRTVDNHMAMLRSKIEEDPANPRYLITVYSVGYKLTLDNKKK